MDKRRAARRDVDLAAEVYTRSEKVLVADAENMSDEGVCLTLGEEVPADDLVGISLYPVDDGIEDPDAEPLHLPAKVVWCYRRRGTRVLAGMRIIDPADL